MRPIVTVSNSQIILQTESNQGNEATTTGTTTVVTTNEKLGNNETGEFFLEIATSSESHNARTEENRTRQASQQSNNFCGPARGRQQSPARPPLP